MSYLTLTHISFELTNNEFPVEEHLGLYNFFKSLLKRLYLQTFLTEEILLYTVELFRLVLAKAEQADVAFSQEQDSIFKVFMTCFFISTKFNDEVNYISIEDLAYIAHSQVRSIKAVELVILKDVLDWKLVSLKEVDENGAFRFFNWNYYQVVSDFKNKLFRNLGF
jgi:hypothetical protein